MTRCLEREFDNGQVRMLSCCTESCGKCIGHVGDESEGQSPGDDSEDEGEHDEAVHDESDHHRAEVPAELVEDNSEVLSAEDLTSDEEEDADRSEVDDPGRDDHHRVRETREEVQQRFACQERLRLITLFTFIHLFLPAWQETLPGL